MGDENLPAIVPTTDILGKDEEALQEYVARGSPGFDQVTRDEAAKICDLYLHGKNYRQISGIMRMPRILVMYLSQSMQCFEKRQAYMAELGDRNFPRIMENRLETQDLLLDIHSAWRKKIRARVTRYMQTDDESQMAKLNLKEIELFLKIDERLQKSIEAPKSSAPLVGINVPEGATLTRTGENTMEVTPKDKAMDGMLKKFADMRRADQKK